MSGKILISACLAGHPVRYNGSAKPLAHPLVDKWRAEGRLVTVCPELMAGFSIPRLPAEIAAGGDGESVLSGKGRVIEETGGDVTAQFVAGAQAALAVAQANDCRFALLIDGSPSCGSRTIYDRANSSARSILVRVSPPLFFAAMALRFSQIRKSRTLVFVCKT